jgi:MYXO-CTERM domain-containing protein
LDCFARVEGGCEAKCTAPNGGLFCNGQYVDAAEVEACITALIAEGVEVDVSARGSVTCDLNGCDGEGSTGCSFTGAGTGGVAFALLGLMFVFWRRRR